MKYIGIDIGSTASKVAILIGSEEYFFVVPTGWNSKDTARMIADKLTEFDVDVYKEDVRIVATGYGRIAVDYADFIITEITCHARGGRALSSDDIGVIDVGGQDTKAILIDKGMVVDFLMNDKCSAGTGKFIEVMANRLGVTLEELFLMAERGKVIPISSTCTVFAESEIINYMGEGRPREDIAAGVIDSVVNKVSQLSMKLDFPETVILTGGLSGVDYFRGVLSEKLGQNITKIENGQFAGALGAALLAKEKKKR